VAHLQGQKEVCLPEVVALEHVVLDAHVQGVLVEVEIQLPLVLEIVEQQALGYPGPLGDGIGAGLFKCVLPELQHGAAADQILPLLRQREEFFVHARPLLSPLPYRR
jgi:hypothetical protein